MEDLAGHMTGGFWRGRSVLVTGASGFVGSWLVNGLVARGARVVGLVHRHEGGGERPSNLTLLGLRERISVVEGDIADLAFLQRSLAEHEIDSCFHLAAQALVGIAATSPIATFDVNICGTWNVLEACRVAGVERIVVASTDKAYGEQPQLPYTEDLPLCGIYPYDASKACADILARSYAHTFGMPLGVSRMTNVYGGGDLNFSRVVPGTIRSILRGEEPVIRSDGTPVRDYLYVSDAVRAYLSLAEHLPGEGVSGEAFNFGTSSPVSVLELVGQIAAAAGAAVAPVADPSRPANHEIDRLYLDPGKAGRLLGWHAETLLDEGLRRTIEWYRAHSELVTF